MEIESAARWECLQDQTINGLAAGRVYRHRLEFPVEGTGGHALVVYREGGWATPDRINSLDFPVLVFDCYGDPTRDPTGLTIREDGEDKAWALRAAIDRRFHARGDEWWGARGTNPGLRVVTCRRYVGAELVTRGGSDRGSLPHSGDTAKTGDVAIVRARYAVEP